MRRLIALLVLPLLLIAAGCGSGDSKTATTAIDKVTVDATGDKQPKVTFDKPLETKKTRSKVLRNGDGPKVTEGERVLVDYVGLNGRTGKVFDSSWENGQPVTFPLAKGQMITGFVKGLIGKKVGSRVLVTIPAKDGYGKQGQKQAHIKGGDSLVFVVDVKDAYQPLAHAKGRNVEPAQGMPDVKSNDKGEPTKVVIPEGAKPPQKKAVAPVIKGEGDKVGKLDTVTLHYTMTNWRTGKTVYSSWKPAQPGVPVRPLDLPMSKVDQAAPALAGLVGQTVGSRVVLVMSLDEAFGKSSPSAKQLKQSGLKKSDSLVFVVDILGAT